MGTKPKPAAVVSIRVAACSVSRFLKERAGTYLKWNWRHEWQFMPAMLLALFSWGCKSENRISYALMDKIERQQRAEAPPVERAEPALSDLEPYTVVPGDVLNITMLGLRDDRYEPVQLQLRVRDNGMIRAPIVGDIEVANMTLAEVDQAIIDKHADVAKDMAVFAQLAETEHTTILVQGAVASPGLITLPVNERNILYALTAAGGFGPGGSGRVHLYPFRSNTPQTFNFANIDDVRRALSEPILQSGDVLVVEAPDEDAVYVTGLVNSPGLVPVPRNGTVSLVRAVAASGGLRDFLDPPEATLWRRMPNGEQVRVKVELDKIINGESLDIALRAGDVLDVPHTAETRFREWFAANIRLGPFGVTAMYDPVADYRARILRNNNVNNDIFRQTLLQSLGLGVSELVVPPAPTALP